MNTRDKIVTKCKIGDIEFVATAASGGQKRRIARYESMGLNGAALEDFGEGARVETIKGMLDEVMYSQLRDMQLDGKVYTIVHPLFNAFEGRIESLTYEAGTKSRVNTTIIVVEDGDQALTTITIVSLPQAANNAKAAGGTFDDDLDDLPGGMPASLDDAADNASNAWSAFDETLDGVLDESVAWETLASSFDTLGDSINSLVEEVDSAVASATSGAVGAVTDIIDSTIVDSAFELVDACREAVEAAQQTASVFWTPFTVIDELSVAELAIEWLGSDSDENIDMILASNPGIIDINAVNVGIELLIPVGL